MSRLEIVVQLKEKKFVAGNLIVDFTWNSKKVMDKLKVHSFIRVTRINNRQKKRKFKRASEYVSFATYLKRIGLVISSEECLKIKKSLRAKQLWINWATHAAGKDIHSEESWAV